MLLSDRTLLLLERSLDAHLVRHNRLAGDIANVETPGYRASDRGFEAEMAQALTRDPEPGQTPPLPAVEATQAPDAAPGSDRVDLDRAMSELAANAGGYSAAARLAGRRLAMLRQVVADGAA